MSTPGLTALLCISIWNLATLICCLPCLIRFFVNLLDNLHPNCTRSCPLTSLTEGRSARDLTQAAPSKKKKRWFHPMAKPHSQTFEAGSPNCRSRDQPQPAIKKNTKSRIRIPFFHSIKDLSLHFSISSASLGSFIITRKVNGNNRFLLRWENALAATLILFTDDISTVCLCFALCVAMCMSL